MRANADLLEITVNSIVDVFFAHRLHIWLRNYFDLVPSLSLANALVSHERRAVAAA